ncbi:hypothetical protein DFH09DRAFT_1098226 [Mycena vulgaris]|nr:hypothetical protein DFH09DRAFT_1098226 [Mycena vulgaris]
MTPQSPQETVHYGLPTALQATKAAILREIGLQRFKKKLYALERLESLFWTPTSISAGNSARRLKPWLDRAFAPLANVAVNALQLLKITPRNVVKAPIKRPSANTDGKKWVKRMKSKNILVCGGLRESELNTISATLADSTNLPQHSTSTPMTSAIPLLLTNPHPAVKGKASQVRAGKSGTRPMRNSDAVVLTSSTASGSDAASPTSTASGPTVPLERSLFPRSSVPGLMAPTRVDEPLPEVLSSSTYSYSIPRAPPMHT